VRKISVVLAVAVAAGAALAAPAASAFPTCDEEISFELAAPVPATAPAPAAAPLAAGPVADAELPVLPCAMVESGLLGPACGDAAFYVVTQAGVLLCSVDVDVFGAQDTSLPTVERAPAAPPSSVSFGLQASAVVPKAVAVPPCAVVDVSVPAPQQAHKPLERSDRPPVPPS
jgi:hypothetical protein